MLLRIAFPLLVVACLMGCATPSTVQKAAAQPKSVAIPSRPSPSIQQSATEEQRLRDQMAYWENLDKSWTQQKRQPSELREPIPDAASSPSIAPPIPPFGAVDTVSAANAAQPYYLPGITVGAIEQKCSQYLGMQFSGLRRLTTMSCSTGQSTHVTGTTIRCDIYADSPDQVLWVEFTVEGTLGIQTEADINQAASWALGSASQLPWFGQLGRAPAMAEQPQIAEWVVQRVGLANTPGRVMNVTTHPFLYELYGLPNTRFLEIKPVGLEAHLRTRN